MGIAKINGIDVANIAKINGIDKASISHILGIEAEFGGSFDADAQPYINALGVLGIVDATLNTAWNDFVIAAKADGYWSKFLACYPFGGGTAAAHAINGKNPGTKDITWSGTVTHNANGITPNGSNGYGNTGISPGTDLSIDDVHLSLYCRSTGANEPRSDFGSLAAGASTLLVLNIRYDNVLYAWFPQQTGGDAFSVSNSDAQGHFIATRIANNHLEAYLDGSSLGTQTGTRATGTMPSPNIYIGALNFNGSAVEHSNRNYAFASVGGGLSDTEAADYYTAVQAFQTALSRNV
jgi:hypothetical protein